MKRRIITTYLLVFALAFGAACAERTRPQGLIRRKRRPCQRRHLSQSRWQAPNTSSVQTMRCMFRCGRNQT